MTLVKICGLTSVEDARAAVDAGADALGVNLWPESKRKASFEVTRSIVEEFSSAVRVVLVVVNALPDELKRLRDELGDVWLQLHGDEPPGLVEGFGPSVIKALPVTSDVVAVADRYRSGELLLDASVAGERGGTGQTADWGLAASVQAVRPVWLAGGLRPGNVGAAVAAVRPYGVDAASGVETAAPGVKDRAKVRAFIDAVRASAV